ncbi:unnamed protein product [Arabis nemorensis]|uniref:Secreted protein n=1 Tax=Arabis nemorensis TaxID=586526 RepID=A0A565BMH1_9BRAS|nr:unnamed protein product [Arabis nemorensis]
MAHRSAPLVVLSTLSPIVGLDMTETPCPFRMWFFPAPPDLSKPLEPPDPLIPPDPPPPTWSMIIDYIDLFKINVFWYL